MASWLSIDDKWDLALLAISASLILTLWIMFGLYMHLRRQPTMQARQRQNKADRPLWVGCTVLGGTLWLLASLHVYGIIVLYYVPDSDNRYGCALMKHGLQYGLGFFVWVNAVLYRMVRTWMTAALGRSRPWRPTAINAVLLVPAAFYAVVCIASDDMLMSPLREYNGVCVEETAWVVATFVLGLAYLLFFTYLIIVLARMWTKLGVMRFYYVSCGLSFVFVVCDFVVALATDRQRLFQQLMMFLVWLIVVAHMLMLFTTIFTSPFDDQSSSKLPQEEDEDDNLDKYALQGLLIRERDQRRLSRQLQSMCFPSAVPALDTSHIDDFEGDVQDPQEHGNQTEMQQKKRGFLDRLLRVKEDKVTGEDDVEDEDAPQEDAVHYIVPGGHVLFKRVPRQPDEHIIRDLVASHQLPQVDVVRVEPVRLDYGVFYHCPPDHMVEDEEQEEGERMEGGLSFIEEMVLVKKYFAN